jgi:hypothetical protein
MNHLLEMQKNGSLVGKQVLFVIAQLVTYCSSVVFKHVDVEQPVLLL